MNRFAQLASLRRLPAWLLAIGLFAVVMQALGGSGLVLRGSAAGGFYTGICTSKGVGMADLARQSGTTSLPDSGHQDCCRLCVASAPLLLAGTTLGVPPAPTFSGVFRTNSVSRPSAVARLSHPPRGPPAA